MISPSSSSIARGPAAERLRLILARLPRAQEAPAHARRRDPLDSLIGTVLSQNTTDANSGRAFAQLKARFPSWQAAARARPGEIAAAIRSGGLADIKSRRIRAILRKIEDDRGRLDLRFLKRMPLAEARSYLTSLPGVGPKTAACVLLFSLGRPAFPVDTHVLRVSKRLGLLPVGTTMERAHDVFPELVAPGQMLALHPGLVRHGREVCRARRPRCEVCRLAELCPRIGVVGRRTA